MNSCWVKSIGIENFRNIKSCEVSFCGEVNIITGKNGQGKTNLLEAIWLLTGAKSFRGSRDKDLINYDYDFSKINAIIKEEKKEKNIELLIAATDNKKGRFARVNGSQQERASSLAGKFYCVVFCPQHLSLVAGSPTQRRKFMDGALCQLYPSYIKTFKTFERYLEQKNSLLKNINRYKKSEADEILEVYNKNLGNLGYEIYKKRKEYTDKLSQLTVKYYEEISEGQESITLEYISFGEKQEDFYNLLLESIEKDKRAGFSCCGVQREDINIQIDGVSAKDFASQGQQRSIVLAMKLSEGDILKVVTEVEPVVLLDDVLSELDTARQDYLLHHIDKRQVFISCCDEERINLAKSKKYFVKSGAIMECI